MTFTRSYLGAQSQVSQHSDDQIEIGRFRTCGFRASAETADLREHLTGTPNSKVPVVGIPADQSSSIFVPNHRLGTFARTMDTKSR